MKSLKLNNNTWDLTLDSMNNIAIVSDELEEINQTACCITKTFKVECIFDTSRGIPYLDDNNILGNNISRTSNTLENYMSYEIAKVYGDIKSIDITNVEYDSYSRTYKANINISLNVL